jgi:mRNA-degrading endonuclease RelE of RelBE toxin-antitoxin system
MPTDPSLSIRIEYTAEFKRNLRILAKKYRHIRSDVQPLIDHLEAGDFVGDKVSGSGYTIFKVRVKNSDIQKGKRSGYRVLYWLKTSRHVVLITIYSKLDQGDISPKQIRRILKEFG